jgi:quaternary ammonium compound-resistance protein SugE
LPVGEEGAGLRAAPLVFSGMGGEMYHWTLLFVAGLLEVGWAVGLKYAEGFTRLWPSVWTLAAMAASMYLLALAARGLPIGTAYAVWTGVGAVGTAAVGMILFGESREWLRLVCIGLIVSGVLGLKFAGR